MIRDEDLLKEKLFSRVLSEFIFVAKLLLIDKQNRETALAQYKIYISFSFLDTLNDEEIVRRFEAFENLIHRLNIDKLYTIHVNAPFTKLLDMDLKKELSFEKIDAEIYVLTLHTLNQNGNFQKVDLIVSKDDLLSILKSLNKKLNESGSS